MRCAIIEAETREEVMQEMEERIRNMEKMFARRLMNEVSTSLAPQSRDEINVLIACYGSSYILGRAT